MARKVVSNGMCTEVMAIRQVSRCSRMPTLHVGLLEYTWKMIGEAPGGRRLMKMGPRSYNHFFY